METKVPENFLPTGSRMFCRKICDVQPKHGIIVPEEAKQSSTLFEVISKGPGCIDDLIQPGTHVYAGKFASWPVDLPWGQDFNVLNEVDALGVVTKFRGQEEIKAKKKTPGPGKKRKA